MESKNCIICNNLFYKKPSTSKNNWHNSKYCSKKCQHKSLFKSPSIRICEQCGKEYERSKGHHEQRFCSNQCFADSFDYHSRPQSQYNPNKDNTETILCNCGCGTEIPKYDSRGRPRKFEHGHVNIGRPKPKTQEQIEKQRKSLRDGGKVKGKNHPNWKGGISEPMKALRRTEEYDNWRFAVYKRDHYTCQHCNKHCKSKDIVAHHIESFRHNPKLRYDIDNGITLCRSCHIKLHKEITTLHLNPLISTI